MDRWTSLLTICAMLTTSYATASSRATVLITYSVNTLDLIQVSPSVVALTTNIPSAGQEPFIVTDDTSTYSITTNGSSRKIYGSYAPLMQGPLLIANLAAPQGAVSAGNVTLSDQPTPLVIGLTNVSQNNLPITYTVSTSASNSPQIILITITYTIAP